MDGGDGAEADTFLGVEVEDDPSARPPDGGDEGANGGGDHTMDGGGDDAMGDSDGDGDGTGEGEDEPEPELDLENLGVDDTPPVRDDAITVCTVHSGPVYAVAAVGAILATGSGDDTGALLTPDPAVAGAAAVAAAAAAAGTSSPPPAGTLFPLAHTSSLGESVSAVALSADGAYAAYGAENGVVAVRGVRGDTAQGVTLFEEATAAIHFVAFHPRGPVVLAGDADGTGWMVNAATSSFMAVFAGHGGAVTCGGWSPDGRTAVTGAADGVVRVWDPKATTVAVSVSNERGDYHPAGVGVVALALHPSADTPVGASGGDDGSVYLWSTATGKVLTKVPPHAESVEAVAFSPAGGEHLAAAALDGTLRVWDVAVSAERGAAAHDAGVTAVAWHPTERGMLLKHGACHPRTSVRKKQKRIFF
ncbi:hypothetical protein I4F81_008845 [Pyropia yezoensis]|uniref:Uncharacterized protein n=1 Tax=Pyropia yezoensis TaxID=2788 RepID=A0ACC3C7X8_PYRYE|nr:hypothetical protein I4F81_008845 [Neopyropia yezoensis]